jgi:hypothetical protein
MNVGEYFLSDTPQLFIETKVENTQCNITCDVAEVELDPISASCTIIFELDSNFATACMVSAS